ncbi:hypothetical protein M3Y97_00679500 [Aphelenchoides bicaudatus]|nr:hypothetical protein M3Y97_00679500 [Aphelenchoides bicaudatus]
MLQSLSNTSSNRNFRVQFLERLCSSDPNAQIRLSSETGRLFLEKQLNQKGDLDVPKLAKFTIRYSIPQKHRLEKYLLHGKNLVPLFRPIVKKKQHMFGCHFKTILFTYMINSLVETPTSRLIAMMVLLSKTDATIVDIQTTHFESAEHKALLIIARQMSIIAKAGENSDDTNYSWEDIYWLTSQFNEKLFIVESSILESLVEETMQSLKAMQEKLLSTYGEVDQGDYEPREVLSGISRTTKQPYYIVRQKETEPVYTCFDRITTKHVEVWFRSAGALWLCDEALFMLWDKLCAHDAILPILKAVLRSIFTTIVIFSSETYKRE